MKVVFAIMLLAAPEVAAAMPVSEFLIKADALEKKGPMALFSGDLKLLKKEVERSAAALREERLAAIKAGRKPAYCPPEKAGLGSKELLTRFRAIPASEQAMPVRDALRGVMVAKYPCRS